MMEEKLNYKKFLEMRKTGELPAFFEECINHAYEKSASLHWFLEFSKAFPADYSDKANNAFKSLIEIIVSSILPCSKEAQAPNTGEQLLWVSRSLAKSRSQSEDNSKKELLKAVHDSVALLSPIFWNTYESTKENGDFCMNLLSHDSEDLARVTGIFDIVMAIADALNVALAKQEQNAEPPSNDFQVHYQ